MSELPKSNFVIRGNASFDGEEAVVLPVNRYTPYVFNFREIRVLRINRSLPFTLLSEGAAVEGE